MNVRGEHVKPLVVEVSRLLVRLCIVRVYCVSIGWALFAQVYMHTGS
jgi:hypothetical protein